LEENLKGEGAKGKDIKQGCKTKTVQHDRSVLEKTIMMTGL